MRAVGDDKLGGEKVRRYGVRAVFADRKGAGRTSSSRYLTVRLGGHGPYTERAVSKRPTDQSARSLTVGKRITHYVPSVVCRRKGEGEGGGEGERERDCAGRCKIRKGDRGWATRAEGKSAETMGEMGEGELEIGSLDFCSGKRGEM